MKKKVLVPLVLPVGLLVAATASAHVSITSGAASANTSQEVSFGVGHGCERPGGGTADTIKLTIDIPAGVTSVRPVPNAFGKVTVAGGANGTSVTWEKAPGDVLPADTSYYKLTIRLKAPNAPFTKVYFPVHQWCDGVAAPTEWVGTPGSDAGASPAAELVVVPARQPGWNKYTIPADLKDLSFFKDALIVWKGSAAYSANPITLAQIKAEPGVVELTELKANDEVWVRY